MEKNFLIVLPAPKLEKEIDSLENEIKEIDKNLSGSRKI